MQIRQRLLERKLMKDYVMLNFLSKTLGMLTLRIFREFKRQSSFDTYRKI